MGGTNMLSEATGDCGLAGKEAVFVIQGESRIGGVSASFHAENEIGFGCCRFGLSGFPVTVA
ncbi:hypothetical protein [Parapedobacter sp.]